MARAVDRGFPGRSILELRIVTVEQPTGPWLITFAVPEEARPFLRRLRRVPTGLNIRCRITGMGAANATRALQEEFARERPAAVLTCGFAGGLNPRWPTGTVLWEADANFPISSRWVAAELPGGTFHCAATVAVSVEAKSLLFRETGNDAVEMESGVIRRLCSAAGIPSATVRVISDAADQDLPLDFNRLVDHQMRLRMGLLVWEIAKTPACILRLIRFQRQIAAAADGLAEMLSERMLRKEEHHEV